MTKSRKVFCSGSVTYGKAFVSEVFKPLFQKALSNEVRVGLEIRQDIILEAYQNALKDRDAPSRAFQLIAAISPQLSLEKKLDVLEMKFKKYPLMPVITSHPTYPLSIVAIQNLCYIIDGLMQLEAQKGHASRDSVALTQAIQAWAEGRLVPETHLTPEDEADFALFLYKRILSVFPKFHEQIVKQFQRVHGGEYEMISGRLKVALMESFRHVFSWSKADFDGNDKRTRETLESTIPSLQRAILELYLASLQRILRQLDKKVHLLERATLQDTHDYFSRCVEAIESGIWFDVVGSEKVKKRTLFSLQKVAASFSEADTKTTSNDALAEEVLALCDLIDLAGFFGGLKEYTRQTTHLNRRVLNDLFGLLADEFREVQLALSGGVYADLCVSERQKLLAALRKHPRYFESLKSKTELFGKETQQELARLDFVLKHRDIFPSYIFSETEGKVNLDEVSVLFYFSAYLAGRLRIGQIQQYPVNPLILCETPKDIRHFSKTLDGMFRDTAIRDKIVKSHVFSYVGGVSDLGKKGGIFVYIALLRAMLDAAQTLEDYQNGDERLAQVKLLVLHGFGGDAKRRHGSSALEAHATQQHFDAFRNLGATGAYLAYLHRVVGHPAESHFRAEEFRRLGLNEPDAFSALELIESTCTQRYEQFINSSTNKALLTHLTSFELERALNVSSRAGSKSTLDDPTNIRAIGVVNLYVLTGIQWDIFMSMEGMLALSPSVLAHLPLLLDDMTVLKDIVYKVWFSIAVADFESAWLRVNGGNTPSVSQIDAWADLYITNTMPKAYHLHCMLAHIEVTAKRLLACSTHFFSGDVSQRASKYLEDANQHDVPVNEMALGFMDTVAGDMVRLAEETRALLPYFARLRACVTAYEAHPSEQTKENAVLACRGGGWVVTGPAMIAGQMSPLHEQAISGEQLALDVFQDEQTGKLAHQ
ncbi:MAG: phosphoenolpyruvate carboxylase [Legionellaceae bacterium]|nr:phosphoenolpyruvate carboxylase [Legionellaceae bacterium]